MIANQLKKDLKSVNSYITEYAEQAYLYTIQSLTEQFKNKKISYMDGVVDSIQRISLCSLSLNDIHFKIQGNVKLEFQTNEESKNKFILPVSLEKIKINNEVDDVQLKKIENLIRNKITLKVKYFIDKLNFKYDKYNGCECDVLQNSPTRTNFNKTRIESVVFNGISNPLIERGKHWSKNKIGLSFYNTKLKEEYVFFDETRLLNLWK
jgi:hypothetical protein